MRLRACAVAGLLAVSVVMMGCFPGILTKPALDKVKSVALVSVYMNRDFYNVNVPSADSAEGSQAALNALGSILKKKSGSLKRSTASIPPSISRSSHTQSRNTPNSSMVL